jgi:hypothetical protein
MRYVAMTLAVLGMLASTAIGAMAVMAQGMSDSVSDHTGYHLALSCLLVFLASLASFVVGYTHRP